jgi:hypothetical protein
MKKTLFIIAMIVLSGCMNFAYSQDNSNKSKLVLIEIDTKEFENYNSVNGGASITEITRLELEKLNIYDVVNKYDIQYLMKRDSLHFESCFSTYCIQNVGEKMSCDKVFTGSVFLVGEKIVIVFKVYDTSKKRFTKQIVKEYLNYPLQITMMIRYTLRELHSLPINTDKMKTITNKFQFDESINNPYKSILRSDGPRMGVTIFSGTAADILTKEKKDGGYNAQPVMFQFGYQFEKQYLNEGNFQALFEFLPMVTGLEQGMFIPSFTFLNGIRNNKNGWEFAFGPTLSVVKKAKGFYDENGEWHLESDAVGQIDKHSIEHRLDSRGSATIHASFVFAVGRTFKSGNLNIPINAFIIPGKNGSRFGVSFGFNSRERFVASPI